ncbi:MAG TPA: amidohydrolase family protein [Gemmatimonadaceae bacterium]|nr:amidohydrolase family protein [Gemmatimonadaceae bacterium]
MITYIARWVLPISAPPIENGAVAVDDGRIQYVGAASGAPRGDRVDLGDALLMPGLVNAHCHLELTAMRGFLEDLDFPQWILRLNGVKRAVLDRERMLDAARLGLVEGIRHGITTYADTCDTGVAFDAMLEAGIRGIMYQEVFGPDPRQCEESMAGLRAKVDMLRPRQTALVRVGVSPHAPYTVSDDLYAAVARYAEDESLGIAVHIAESEAERELVAAGDGFFARGLRKRGIDIQPRARSSIELLQRTGVLQRRPLLIHCVRLDATDIANVASHAAPIAHCPISNAKLGHGTAPLLEFLDAGVTVALGSDSVASNNRMDMLAEARAAVLAQRARVARHDVLCARDALQVATLGGARALGLDAEIGTLEAGKSADLAAFPLAAHVAPVHDADSTAIFALPGTAASLVVVAGRELVVEGRLLAEDSALVARVDASARLMAEWARAQATTR